ncbi:MAG TPA: SDR family NAD(P)-dependent oxidoreductase [Candidatus Binatia bacterium]|nr:SDR family NAD(P)-dependent oxidoreductase [Candidatus Binatia bacterium]
MGRLENRIAIVTGAGQGIGRAIALGMAREGAALVIADLDEANAGAVKREIERGGGKASALYTDISNEGSVRGMIDHTLNEHGRVDILVNNAGIFPTSSVEEMAEEEWDRVIGTNLIGTFLCSRAVVPHLLTQRSGRIISLTSGRAFQGARHGSHYAASKAGIIGFSKSLALEIAPYGITVNVICPGITDTAQPRGHQTEEQIYAQGQRIPLGRIGQPEDLAGPAIFLASDAAGFITGQTILANGGGIMW